MIDKVALEQVKLNQCRLRVNEENYIMLILL